MACELVPTHSASHFFKQSHTYLCNYCTVCSLLHEGTGARGSMQVTLRGVSTHVPVQGVSVKVFLEGG